MMIFASFLDDLKPSFQVNFLLLFSFDFVQCVCISVCCLLGRDREGTSNFCFGSLGLVMSLSFAFLVKT